MRNFAMTFPAQTVFKLVVIGCSLTEQTAVGYQFTVAAKTVFLYNPDAVFLDKNILWLEPQGEHAGMAHPVFCLKKISAKNVVVRNMTIGAGGMFAMRAVLPGGILGSHNMAVDTSFGSIRQIRPSLAGIYGIQSQSHNHSTEQHHHNPLLRRRNEVLPKTSGIHVNLGIYGLNFVNKNKPFRCPKSPDRHKKANLERFNIKR